MKTKYAVTFGEVMMRLSTPAFARFTQAKNFNIVFGGAEANVGISLTKFGIPATHVTRLAEHDLGKSVVQYLNGHGVDTSYIQFGTERLGMYFVENGAMHRAPRIIYDRSDSAFANIKSGQFDWDAIMQQASWFHWTGITPAISQGAADECLAAIHAARKQGVWISGDINYRRNLWQYGKSATDVMPGLIEGTDYMVAAVTDITNCLGIKADDFETACSRVMKQCPSIKKIACTQRGTIDASHNTLRGILWNGKQRLTSREYDLTHIVDRIGGGDAYMAGLIYGWMRNFDDQQTVEFATATSALKHSIEGDANEVTVDEVQSLVKNENTGKLLR